jgi:hypothetical protein
LSVDDDGSAEAIEDALGQSAVLGDALGLQHTAVGGEADSAKVGHVVQATAEGAVAGVVDRRFGEQGAFLLEVLLDLGGLIATCSEG